METCPRLFIHSLAVPLLATIGMLSLAASTLAEESVGSVQKALRDRGFFFREPDGNLDDATVAALKKAPVRGGARSGPTLSARERAQTGTQSDRDFLEKIDPVEVAERPPVDPRSEPNKTDAPPP